MTETQIRGIAVKEEYELQRNSGFQRAVELAAEAAVARHSAEASRQQVQHLVQDLDLARDKLKQLGYEWDEGAKEWKEAAAP